MLKTFRHPGLRYGVALLAPAAAVAGGVALQSTLHVRGFPLLLAGVALSAWYGGMGPGLLSTLLAGAGAALFLIPARGGVPRGGPEEALHVALAMGLALLLGSLYEEIRAARTGMLRSAEQSDRVLRELQGAQAGWEEERERLRAAEAALDLLAEAGRVPSGRGSGPAADPAALASVLESAGRLVSAQACVLRHCPPGAGGWRVVYESGPAAESLRAAPLPELAGPMPYGPFVAGDVRSSGGREDAEVRSLFSHVFRTPGGGTASLIVGSGQPHAFGPEQTRLLTTLAATLSPALAGAPARSPVVPNGRERAEGPERALTGSR